MSPRKVPNYTSTNRYAFRPRKVAGIIKIPPSSPLPTEIVREIMGYTTEEDHDLTLVSLISSDWVPVTRSMLFEEVVVTFDELEEFIRLVTSPYCSLTSHVRKLLFRQVPRLQPGKLVKRNFKIFAESMWRIVQLLPNVKWLCLEDFDFHSESHEICSNPYPGLDRIETLVLRRGIFDNLPFAIEEVLTPFPRIRTLQCEWLSHRQYKPTKSQDLTRRPPTNFLPELVELSFVQPEDGLVAVINSRLSLQHVQRVIYKYDQYDTGGPKIRMLPAPKKDSIFTMLGLIGPSLEYLAFTRLTVSAYSFLSPRPALDFHPNPNLHTLELVLSSFLVNNLARKLLSTITVHSLRTLVLNISLACGLEGIDQILTLAPDASISRAFDQRPDVFDRLEKFICCVREKYSEDSSESIIRFLRKFLDPHGRRRWWEKGILEIVF